MRSHFVSYDSLHGPNLMYLMHFAAIQVSHISRDLNLLDIVLAHWQSDRCWIKLLAVLNIR
jgi:hypothetical protein